ncbi:type II toxin-antitoxin system YhaV family toxin [Pleurocapsa sp. PCC 7319]|uniref:type II toxin-antitoxin system YhaV family toxin n=1 Tax=Pleurocapsa sp. PCC 7319 TaxID=118161 RepID=UPI0003707CA7|nr:type II toxin-antitoxin system YhaV family toxin [Pleurocapsa sp. PCC 7319]
MKINGWTILFHPLFNDQWQQLLHQVKSLHSRLPTDDFVKHPQVELFKALTVGIEEKIPHDPLASYFALRKPLDKYSRLKKMGLPIGFADSTASLADASRHRYRLFFKVFPQQKVIIILWLGFPRKEGDKKDCYRIFAKMVKKGQFPLSLKDLIDSDNGQES